MSLRNNKATKLNRYMMFGTLFLGILVIGCVYLAYNGQQPTDNGQQTTDSLVLVVNDSTLLEE